jgi:hypothetical protein
MIDTPFPVCFTILLASGQLLFKKAGLPARRGAHHRRRR